GTCNKAPASRSNLRILVDSGGHVGGGDVLRDRLLLPAEHPPRGGRRSRVPGCRDRKWRNGPPVQLYLMPGRDEAGNRRKQTGAAEGVRPRLPCGGHVQSL